MRNLKSYKRWPRNRNLLQKRLKKICSRIDEYLSEDFTATVLRDEDDQKKYKSVFTKIWRDIGYHWDLHPEIKIENTGKICGASITIDFWIKDRDGTPMHC